jgi:hypothetical protein
VTGVVKEMRPRPNTSPEEYILKFRIELLAWTGTYRVYISETDSRKIKIGDQVEVEFNLYRNPTQFNPNNIQAIIVTEK